MFSLACQELTNRSAKLPSPAVTLKGMGAPVTFSRCPGLELHPSKTRLLEFEPPEGTADKVVVARASGYVLDAVDAASLIHLLAERRRLRRMSRIRASPPRSTL